MQYLSKNDDKLYMCVCVFKIFVFLFLLFLLYTSSFQLVVFNILAVTLLGGSQMIFSHGKPIRYSTYQILTL